jgi:hypothetical protein
MQPHGTGFNLRARRPLRPCRHPAPVEYFSMINFSLFRAAFVAALIASAAHAQATTPAPGSVAGLWNASMETPGGTSAFQLDLKVRGDTLSGTVKRARGDVALSGTVKDNVVDFSYTIDYNGNPFTLSVHATVSGDTMTGTVDLGGNGEEPFSAKRVPAGKPGP